MKRIVTAGIALALTGCAGSSMAPPTSPGGRRPTPVTVEGRSEYTVDLVREDQITTGWIDVPVEEAWSSLAAVYARLGFDMEDFSEYVPAARRVTVQGRVRRIADERMSRYLNCGHAVTGDKADQGIVNIFLSTWLEPKNEGTTVHTRFEAEARDRGTSATPAPCGTRGRIEQMIADQLLLQSSLDDIGG